MKKVLIIGEQNLFRSIILAELLKDFLIKRGKSDIEVKSAGVYAMPGIPVDEEVKQELAKYVEGNFTSTPLLKQDVIATDIVLTINSKIKNAILNKFPEKKDSVFTVKEFAGEKDFDIVEQKITAEYAISIINKFIDRF